jgi:hypothetical protein
MASIRQDALWDFIPTQNIRIVEKPKPAKAVKPRTVVARFLHLGAGVQSSTIVEMIVEGDLPRVDAVIFADTGNEPRHVYKQVEYLRGRLASINIPLAIVKRPNSEGLVKDILSKAGKGRFATMPLYSLNNDGSRSILMRQCTNDYKIVPCDDFILSWLLERGHAKTNKAGAWRVETGVSVLNTYGISADEKHRTGNQAQLWKVTSNPLIDKNMGRMDCESYLQNKGLPIPKKSSCKVCPYHNDAYWHWMSTTTPDEFEETCVFDDWLRSDKNHSAAQLGQITSKLFLHESCQPLRSIDFAARVEAKKSKQMDMFAVELIDGAVCASNGGFSCFS